MADYQAINKLPAVMTSNSSNCIQVWRQQGNTLHSLSQDHLSDTLDIQHDSV